MFSGRSNFHHLPPPPHMDLYHRPVAQPRPPYHQRLPPFAYGYNNRVPRPPFIFLGLMQQHQYPERGYDDGWVYYDQQQQQQRRGYNDRRRPRNRNRNQDQRQQRHHNYLHLIEMRIVRQPSPPTYNNYNAAGAGTVGFDNNSRRRGPRNRNYRHNRINPRQHQHNYLTLIDLVQVPPMIIMDDHARQLLQHTNQLSPMTNNNGLSEETIVKHLRTRRIEADAPDYDQDKICVVCQDSLFEQDEIAILHCGHDYHPECIKNWLFQNNTCPLCKSTGIHLVD